MSTPGPGNSSRSQSTNTRQPYAPKLVLRAGVPCWHCDHPRSSHSMLILAGRCKADRCPCPMFEPVCGCRHLLGEHSWGTPPDYWGCALCPCRHFGPQTELAPA